MKKMVSAISEDNYTMYRDKRAGVDLIGSSKYQWYKIGHSQDIRMRIANYRSLTFVVDIRHTWITIDKAIAVAEEIRLHKLYKSCKIRANGNDSEWFYFLPEHIEAIELMMSEYPQSVSPQSCVIDYAAIRSIKI